MWELHVFSCGNDPLSHQMTCIPQNMAILNQGVKRATYKNLKRAFVRVLIHPHRTIFLSRIQLEAGIWSSQSSSMTAMHTHTAGTDHSVPKLQHTWKLLQFSSTEYSVHSQQLLQFFVAAFAAVACCCCCCWLLTMLGPLHPLMVK